MFNSLDRVNIIINEYGIIKRIGIDNNKKEITLNDNIVKMTSSEYDEFLSSFFRIIRFWESNKGKVSNNILLDINIVEKEKEYDLLYDEFIPDNYDLFDDLVKKLK